MPKSSVTWTPQQLAEHLRKRGEKAIVVKKKPVKMKTSPLAMKFEMLWHNLGGQPLVAEHRFHPVRKWRFDYAHLATKTAVELDGILYGQGAGRHQRGAGYIGDCEKFLEAKVIGWHVFRLPMKLVTGETIARIIEFIHDEIIHE